MSKSNKTLKLFSHFHRILQEQGEIPPDPTQEQGFDTTGGQDVTDLPEPAPEEEMPMSSEGEDRYISDIIDAALYEPSAEDSQVLTNLQSAMQMKKYTNAREEILPVVLNIIRPSTEGNEMRDDLNAVQ